MTAPIDSGELRVPPHSLSAEQSVLGSLMLYNSTWDRIADLLTEADFCDRAHRIIWHAIAELAAQDQPFDVVTLADTLERTSEIEDAGGLSYLGTLVAETPTVANVVHYARIVRRHADARRVITACLETVETAHTGTSPDTARDALHAQLASIAAGPGRIPRTISAAELGATEFPPVRWAVPGLIPEGLTLLAGKPKMGKSWLALAVAIAVSIGGRALSRYQVPAGDVLYLALEDRERRLRSRMDLHLKGAAYPARLELATEWPRGDEGIAALRAWLAQHPAARLVVIDTLVCFRVASTGRRSAYDQD